MGQKKLIRFEAIKSFPNVLQYPEGMAGRWAAFYRNDHSLTLELACGKGEYTVGLAKMYPERNFLGVDMKGNRIYIGAKKCLEENIANAAFLRTHIDKVTSYFHKGEVEEIWLTFPDPQLRKSRFTRRLTHPKFIRLYQQILKPGGRIHLKTDSPVLYQFTKWVAALYGLTLLEDSADIHAAPMKDELKIRTHYESLDIAQSKRVHYLCFTIPEEPLPDRDQELHEKVKQEEPTPPERVRPPRNMANAAITVRPETAVTATTAAEAAAPATTTTAHPQTAAETVATTTTTAREDAPNETTD
ncbi:MAG TPA: tRNA (guanosine(46)-N7)-methyltransferase TrmB [Puia sp.]|nr:tRNA (guanosine(46)-N7)-methyltransferase TrmB [Puia sp.]